MRRSWDDILQEVGDIWKQKVAKAVAKGAVDGVVELIDLHNAASEHNFADLSSLTQPGNRFCKGMCMSFDMQPEITPSPPPGMTCRGAAFPEKLPK